MSAIQGSNGLVRAGDRSHDGDRPQGSRPNRDRRVKRSPRCSSSQDSSTCDPGPEHGQSEEDIRIVLLANRPRMFREMLHRALEKTDGMRLILETEDTQQIPNILGRVDADWLIVSLAEDDTLPQPVLQALDENPELSVIGLSETGNHMKTEVSVHQNGRQDGQRERRTYSLKEIALSDLLKLLR